MRSALLLVPALLLSGAVASHAEAACATAGAGAAPSARAAGLSVSLSAARSSVQRGHGVAVRIDVRALAPEGVKVDGSNVTLQLKHGAQVLGTATGTTDASGSVTLVVNVRRSAPLGAADAVAVAEREIVPSYDCTRPLLLVEGSGSRKPLVRVVP